MDFRFSPAEEKNGGGGNKLLYVLMALLAISAFYIAYSEFSRFNSAQLSEAALMGYQIGVRDSVEKLFQETDGCSVVPITLDNTTRQLIDVQCMLSLTSNVSGS